MEIKRIAVVGNGLMGKGIAQSFGAYGYQVYVFARRDSACDEIMEYYKNETAKGRITPQQKENLIINTSVYNIISQPQKLADCDFIIETVAEDINIKGEIFAVIAKYAREDTPVASNTSSYPISKLAEYLSNPERFMGTHFFSPVPLMKLVEVVKGEKTSEASIEAVCNVLKKVDKLPIEVKDSPGFVLNRGILLLINEATHIFNENLANSVEDIDTIFVNGMGLKVGPLRLADLIGIDVIHASLTNLYYGLKNDKYKPCSLMQQMVDKGENGKKAGKGFYNY